MHISGLQDRRISLAFFSSLWVWVTSYSRQFLIATLRLGPIPDHVAFIMDGNRRYATENGISTAKGHFMGALAMEEVIETCYQCGVKVVTVYALSIENFKRPKRQLDAMSELAQMHIASLSQHGGLLDRNGASVRVLGRLEMLSADNRRAIDHASDSTRHYGENILNICTAYASRDEIARAVQATVAEHTSEYAIAGLDNVSNCTINEQTLTAHMLTRDDPPLDLLLRTSGVQRLSDFLLWQCHERTHIEFVEDLWPAFGSWKLLCILLKWQRIRTMQGIS